MRQEIDTQLYLNFSEPASGYSRGVFPFRALVSTHLKRREGKIRMCGYKHKARRPALSFRV